MKTWLIDSGPLVALLVGDDHKHAWTLEQSKQAPATDGPVRDLMRRYRSRPMAFADACLVRMAEIRPDAVVWTLDRDFHFYRKRSRQTLSLVTPW